MDRVDLHAVVAKWLEDQSDEALCELLSDEAVRGWGMSRTITVNEHSVFVKTLPLTGRELALPESTLNHYDLPLFYNYGVGSAGFGAYRELQAHRKTTSWVLNGEIAHFPLLYHARVLPLAAQTRMMDEEALNRYVAYWDNVPEIRAFIEARQQSTHAVALFIEHIPFVLEDWLPLNQEAIGLVMDQAIATTAHMRDRGVVHLDAYPSNVLTDGSLIFFGDLGLFLDRDFDLSADERAFVHRHRDYDIAEFLCGLSDQRRTKSFDAEPHYQHALEPYRPLIQLITRFIDQMVSGPKSGDYYDEAAVEQALLQATPVD